jgi:hypothetical protein
MLSYASIPNIKKAAGRRFAGYQQEPAIESNSGLRLRLGHLTDSEIRRFQSVRFNYFNGTGRM